MALRASRALLLVRLSLVPAAVLLPPVARAWAQNASAPAVPPEATAPPDAAAPVPAPPSAVPPSAFAPQPAPPPVASTPEATAAVEATPLPVRRPRLSAAVGMGATFDAVGFDDGNARAIPAFFTMLGIGDGPWGFDVGAFASQAAGRHGNQSPVERLALDAYGVIRPGAWYRPDDVSYGARVLHGLGAELGLGFERDGRSAVSGTRFLLHTGLRLDLPISPAGEPTELKLRFATRRGIGLYTPKLYGNTVADVLNVDDSALELYAALVVVF
jgi:hypothetical protein